MVIRLQRSVKAWLYRRQHGYLKFSNRGRVVDEDVETNMLYCFHKVV